jgi:homoserine O-succinyltransferase/O-acetyltransferase
MEAFDGASIEIALVNNMPDNAAEATVGQFETLLRRAGQGIAYRLSCYALPRSDVAQCSTSKKTHEGIEALYARGADALIVTGAEPRAQSLADEPFWGDFSRLVYWARNHTLGSVWSCLAAHGAAELLGGVLRRRQKQKISGVFACSTTPGDWATRDALAEILVPHSRYNGLCRDDLEKNGYTVSSWSPLIGVDSFWRREPSLFLFTQGHPEYAANTLANEFRRDVLCFLKGIGVTFPQIPDNYFSESAQEQIVLLKRNSGELDKLRFLEKLDVILKQSSPAANWFSDAERLYRNWLRLIVTERKQGLSRP